MNNRTTILILSAVLIAAALSGCMQEISEIGVPGGAPEAAAPDAAQPAPASEAMTSSVPAPPMIVNWKYIGYRNLSISNAPALNQTARVTYSIIPDRDIKILSVGIHIPKGFVFVDANDAKLDTYTEGNFVRHSAFWTPTNLSKDEMYQFSAAIKAVKTGNWTIVAFGGSEGVYISVSKDSAYISDKPFPEPPIFSITYFLNESELNESEIEKALANIPINSKYNGMTVYRSSHGPINATTTPSKPPKYNITRPTPCPTSCPIDVNLDDRTYVGLRYYWNGTAWVEGEKPVMSNQS